MEIHGIVIPADNGRVDVIKLERGDVKAFQAIVGGPLDVVDVDDPAVSVWLNDEGLMNGSALNERATMFIWAGSPALRGVQGYFGDMLITGRPDRNGNTTTVPQGIVDLIFTTNTYEVEVDSLGKDGWEIRKDTFTSYWVGLVWALLHVNHWTKLGEIRVKPA